MIREQRTKNKPRETYIVESLPSHEQKYILIRKLGNSLRTRLYKALPDELILLNDQPTSRDHYSEQDTKHTDPTNNLETNSKPVRAAAKVAIDKIKEMACLVQTHKAILKHGWKEEDQNFELQFTHIKPGLLLRDSCDPSPSTSFNSTRTPSPTPSADESSPNQITTEEEDEEDEELLWDTTPEQIRLTNQPQPDAWTSPPFISHPASASIPPAFPRKRMDAYTYQPLQLRNAFRKRPSIPPFTLSPHTPGPSSQPSRIPVPISPSHVDTSKVSDFSHVLPLLGQPPYAPRRSNRSRQPPEYLGIRRQDDRENREEEEMSRKR